jgi:hypothetical protein
MSLSVLAAFLSLPSGAASSGSSHPDTLVARVASVNGDAVIDKREMKPGDAVLFGQTIELKPKASAKLLTVIDRSILDLSEEATLSFSKATSVETAGVMHLARGLMRASIHPKMTWELAVQGIQYSLHDQVIAIRVSDNGTEGSQEVGMSSGDALVGRRDDNKVISVSESSKMIVKGAIKDGELQIRRGGISHAELSAKEVRDWVDRAYVEDRSFTQQVALGPGENPRARAAAFGFLVPGEAILPRARFGEHAEDWIEPFTTRTHLWELDGSLQQARAQIAITPP